MAEVTIEDVTGSAVSAVRAAGLTTISQSALSNIVSGLLPENVEGLLTLLNSNHELLSRDIVVTVGGEDVFTVRPLQLLRLALSQQIASAIKERLDIEAAETRPPHQPEDLSVDQDVVDSRYAETSEMLEDAAEALLSDGFGVDMRGTAQTFRYIAPDAANEDRQYVVGGDRLVE